MSVNDKLLKFCGIFWAFSREKKTVNTFSMTEKNISLFFIETGIAGRYICLKMAMRRKNMQENGRTELKVKGAGRTYKHTQANILFDHYIRKFVICIIFTKTKKYQIAIRHRNKYRITMESNPPLHNLHSFTPFKTSYTFGKLNFYIPFFLTLYLYWPDKNGTYYWVLALFL